MHTNSLLKTVQKMVDTCLNSGLSIFLHLILNLLTQSLTDRADQFAWDEWFLGQIYSCCCFVLCVRISMSQITATESPLCLQHCFCKQPKRTPYSLSWMSLCLWRSGGERFESVFPVFLPPTTNSLTCEKGRSLWFCGCRWTAFFAAWLGISSHSMPSSHDPAIFRTRSLCVSAWKTRRDVLLQLNERDFSPSPRLLQSLISGRESQWTWLIRAKLVLIWAAEKRIRGIFECQQSFASLLNSLLLLLPDCLSSRLWWRFGSDCCSEE